MSERSDESSSFSDEDWARFQQEAETWRGGKGPKEPSARARMVTARLRELDEQAAARRPRRGRRKAAEPEPWRPDGWRSAPSSRDARDGRRRWRQLAAGVGAVAFVAVAFLAVGPLADTWRGTDAAADAAPLPAETAVPTAAPPTTGPNMPTLEHPFAGSPARRWADGADAIELPEAKAVNGVSAKQVAEGLRLTKKFLVAANLDRDVLNGGSPEQALALIDPHQTDFLDDARHNLKHPGPMLEEDSPLTLFSRFDTDEVRLVGHTVKVRGRMTVRPGSRHGQADVRADYTFVYPVTRAGETDEVTRTVVRRVFEVQVSSGPGGQVAPGKLWVVRDYVDSTNGGCNTRDGLFHPVFPSDRADRPDPTGPSVDPYDRSKPLTGRPAEDECGTATRV